MRMFLAYSARMNTQRIEQANRARRAEWRERVKNSLGRPGGA